MSDSPLDLTDADAVKRDMAEAFIQYMTIKQTEPDGPGAAVAAIRNADTLEDATQYLFGHSVGVFEAGVVYATQRIQGTLANPTKGPGVPPVGPRPIGRRRRKGRR